MNRQELMQEAIQFVVSSDENRIPEKNYQNTGKTGVRIYDAPLLAIGDAADPLFEQLKDAGVIGKHHMSPNEWLPGAAAVISFFLPFSESVKKSNWQDERNPSYEWLYARVEGDAFLKKFCSHLKKQLEESGCHTAAPSIDPRFWTKVGMKKTSDKKELAGMDVYTSNWSERHAAYICGLGTFGLSRGLITKKGIAGRFCSIITDAALPVDTREYSDIYEYCSNCGACAVRCPADAISKEQGKMHPPCSDYLDKTKEMFVPRYGCGKCQTKVPCESGIPKKRR